MDYFAICKTCLNVKCCSLPFFAFASDYEHDQIVEYLQSHNNFFDETQIFRKILLESPFGSGGYLILKKTNGQCIFLQEDYSCLIHECKPVDCQMWPLTFEYDPIFDELILYVGDCPITQYLIKENLLDGWLQVQERILFQNLYKFKQVDLNAYNTLINIPELKFVARKMLPPDITNH